MIKKGMYFHWVGPDFMVGLSLSFKYGGFLVGFGFLTVEIVWRTSFD